MIQEHTVHGFADRVITPERERYVTHPARHMTMGQVFFNASGGVDEIQAVIVMLFDTGRHGKNVRIKDDVFRWETNFFRQNLIRPFTNFKFTFFGIRLTGFIKGHHHSGGTITPDQLCLFNELFFALFQGDGIDHPFTLNTFQAGFDHRPFGTVDHHRHAGNIRFRRNQVQKSDHGLFTVQHGFIHIDINDLGTGFHLLAGHIKGFGIITIQDQLFKFGRSRHIGTFANIDKNRAFFHGVYTASF